MTSQICRLPMPATIAGRFIFLLNTPLAMLSFDPLHTENIPGWWGVLSCALFLWGLLIERLHYQTRRTFVNSRVPFDNDLLRRIRLVCTIVLFINTPLASVVISIFGNLRLPQPVQDWIFNHTELASRLIVVYTILSIVLFFCAIFSETFYYQALLKAAEEKGIPITEAWPTIGAAKSLKKLELPSTRIGKLIILYNTPLTILFFALAISHMLPDFLVEWLINTPARRYLAYWGYSMPYLLVGAIVWELYHYSKRSTLAIASEDKIDEIKV